ncbi:MAG: histidine kinase [Nitrospira sp.]|nr:histidine kinase [Nitrospira sp.]MCB9710694.1 histidine kinase [Nitrospiraceae bacterium]MDR4487717.1 histidine kinase [Nitrospirales bacterium]MCA9476308.1 histidine kinase [Nitrospira sp.]MCA9479000.1 histidine kinase [Nitrospira sp.]
MTTTKTLLIAVTDIFFYTKIRDAFRPQGYTLTRIRNVEDWLTNVDNQSPQAIIANMNDDRLDVPNLLKTIKAQPKIQDVPILAFANHEEVGTWKLAKELGINKIVSRNEFSARTLPLLEEMLASTPPTP